jgi:transcriptional regulator with GAF, ATPase, and Fis domain
MDTREARINEAFLQATAALMRPYDVVDLLSTLMTSCTEILDVQAAGILVADVIGDLELVASTSEEAQIVETMIVDAGAGPCIDAFTTGTIVSVADIATDGGTWPAFRTTALKQGFHSAHAIPMRIRGNIMGVMGLLSTTPRALDVADARIAQSLADIATLGIVHERTFRQPQAISEQFHLALDTRIVIEQAKGILSQRSNISMGAAFDALRGYAREHDTPLRQVAEDTIAHRITPTAPSPTSLP